MMIVSTDQWCAEIGSFNCHSLYLSKCEWDNNHVFLKIFLIYFCHSKPAIKLMFQWKAIIILFLLFVSWFPTASSRTSSQMLGQEKAKTIYHHFISGTLIGYQQITLKKHYF